MINEGEKDHPSLRCFGAPRDTQRVPAPSGLAFGEGIKVFLPRPPA